jgi:NifB/MoaA-like Fe-S oxidoreductase
MGGEPTIREDLFDIIREVNNSGNYPELYTNGLKLADENYVKKLKESNIGKVLISFDGFGEEVHEKLRGDGSQYYKKLKALKNLEKYKIRTHLSSVIANGINEGQIPKLLKFVVNSIQNRGSIRSIDFISATPYGKFNIKIERILTELDIIKILEKIPFAEINREYIIEFERFKRKVSETLGIFGIPFPIMRGFTPKYKVEKNKIKELIPLEDLKKMNHLLEKRKLFSFGLKILKYKQLYPLIKSILKPGELPEVQYDNSNILSMRICLVRVPNMPEPDYDKYSIACIGKHKNKIVLLSPV